MTSTRELEDEIAQMEQRLADAKVVADVERAAWQKVSRTGKRGTKWKSAASGVKDNGKLSDPTQLSKSGAKREDDSTPELTMMPSYWDALELAQFLQSRELPRFAQAVVSEQISGKILLDTSPGKLRLLFPTVDAANDKDASWKVFLRVCSFLHQQQKKLERITANAMGSSRSDTSGRDFKAAKSTQTATSSGGNRSDVLVFPLISPRGIVGNTVAVNNPPAGAPSTASGQKKPTSFAQLRKPGAPTSSSSSSNLPMATCWSCGTRFTRAMPPAMATGAKKSASLKAVLSARPYCSKECRDRIERDDMSVSPALSVSLQCGDSHSLEASDTLNGNTRPAKPVTTSERVIGIVNGGRPPPVASAKTAITVIINHTLRREPEDNAEPELLQVGVTKLAQPDHLSIAHPRPPPSTAFTVTPLSTCHSPTGSRIRTGTMSKSHRGLATASGSFTGSHRSAASIPWTNHSVAVPSSKPMSNEPSLMLSNSLVATAQSRVFQQSRYKLDPEVFQANRITFSIVFGGFPFNASTANTTATYARGNLLKLQEFMSIRALHRLSLTSRAWHELITHPSTLSDALWGVHVLRTWRQSEEDELLLQQIGVLLKPERPRRMLMKLTRQVGRIAFENMKVLLSPENWQLAATMTEADAANTQTLSGWLSTLRRRRTSGLASLSPPSSCSKSGQTGAISFAVQPQPPPELFEHITVIYNPACEIVAIRAQQLIRPLDEKGESLTSVLQGLQRGTLHAVECRRLRLFSLANRLPFEQWVLLPTTRAVFDFFYSNDEPSGVPAAAPIPGTPLRLPVWHQKVLTKQQTAMQQRLLGKESVQQVMRGLQERNGPPEVLISLERFLVASHAQASAVPRSPRARPQPSSADSPSSHALG